MNELTRDPLDAETAEQRERFDDAADDFSRERTRIATAHNSFRYTSDQFHELEREFLDKIEELRRTKVDQMNNFSHLEGLRMRLLTSLDGAYRHAVNELSDAMLASILGTQDGDKTD